MNIGERVIVDAAVTGDGIHHHGVITDIYEFARANFIEVQFDVPDICGRLGTTITNQYLVRKEA